MLAAALATAPVATLAVSALPWNAGVHGSLLMGGALGDLSLIGLGFFSALLAVVYLEEGEIDEEIDNHRAGMSRNARG